MDSVVFALEDNLIIAILVDWLELRDVCRVDSACCHQVARPRLHGLMTSNLAIFCKNIKESQDFSGNYVHYEDILKWIILRKLRIASFWYSTCTRFDQVFYHDLFQHTGQQLASIELSSSVSNSTAINEILMLIGKTCYHLKTLTIRMSGSLFMTWNSCDANIMTNVAKGTI